MSFRKRLVGKKVKVVSHASPAVRGKTGTIKNVRGPGKHMQCQLKVVIGHLCWLYWIPIEGLRPAK